MTTDEGVRLRRAVAAKRAAEIAHEHAVAQCARAARLERRTAANLVTATEAWQDAARGQVARVALAAQHSMEYTRELLAERAS